MPERSPDPLNVFRLEGRVAVITGASSGIGAHFATVLSHSGVRVVVGARRLERLDALADELNATGGDVVPVRCDVRSEPDVRALVAAAVERHGKLDLMINNAGIAPPEDGEIESMSSFADVLAVNLIGLYSGARAAAEPMIAQGSGVIINLASISGLVAGDGPDTPSYIASKGAVVSLTRELGVRWASRGLRVNAIAPAWFRTDMNAAHLADPDGLRFVAERTPIGRPGELPELDGALLFLASDASSYVTGQTLVVDGGWTAK